MNEQQNTSLSPVPPVNETPIPVVVPVPGWFSYSGRYTRAQFWGKWIVCTLILVVISRFAGKVLDQIHICGNSFDSYISQVYDLTVITLIVHTLLLLPLLVKRLHDIGMPTAVAVGVWVLIQGLSFVEVHATIDALESMVNSESLDSMLAAERKMQGIEQTYTIIRGCIGIVMLIVLCLDSQKGSNLYGPSSKYPDAQ